MPPRLRQRHVLGSRHPHFCSNRKGLPTTRRSCIHHPHVLHGPLCPHQLPLQLGPRCTGHQKRHRCRSSRHCHRFGLPLPGFYILLLRHHGTNSLRSSPTFHPQRPNQNSNPLVCPPVSTYSPTQRSVALAVLSVANIIGTAIGFVLPPFFV